MHIGIDVGYNETKAVAGRRRARFPSATGSLDQARFGLGANHALALTQPFEILVGEAAVNQSRFLDRREDRNWINSDAWRALWLTAVTELTSATSVDLDIVAGLPVAFYTESDKQTVIENLTGEHVVQRAGDRPAQRLHVQHVRVIPQPFGTLLSEVLDTHGRITDQALAKSKIGIIDVGGKTCNLLHVHNLSEIPAQTTSVNVGGWDLVRAVRQWLAEHYPGLEDMRDHALSQAIRDRRLNYYGEPVADFPATIDTYASDLAQQIIGAASQLWNGGAILDTVLVTGGGALLLGDHVQRHWRHARVVSEPVVENAVGYWKFSRYLYR